MNISSKLSATELFYSKDFPNPYKNQITTQEKKSDNYMLTQNEMQLEEIKNEQSKKNEANSKIKNKINNEDESLSKEKVEEEKPKFNLIRKINYLNENKLNQQILKLKQAPEISNKPNSNKANPIINFSENCCSKNNFYSIDDKGKKVYNIEVVFDFLQEIDNNSALSGIVGSLLNERKAHILEAFLQKIGKDQFLSILKQALKIENEGGLIKKESLDKMTDADMDLSEQRKSPGGVLFHLLKLPENAIDKKSIRDIFRKDYKLSKEKKKLLKDLDNMAL